MKLLTSTSVSNEYGERPRFFYIDISKEYATDLLQLISAAQSINTSFRDRFPLMEIQFLDHSGTWTSNLSEDKLENEGIPIATLDHGEHVILPDNFNLESMRDPEYVKQWHEDISGDFIVDGSVIDVMTDGLYYDTMLKHGDYHIESTFIPKELLESIVKEN